MKKFLHWTEDRLEILWRRAEASTEVDDQSLVVLELVYGLFVVIIMMPSVS